MTTASTTSLVKDASKSSHIVHEAVIERIFEHKADTRSLFLRLPVEQTVKFRPGQFLSFLLPIAGQTVTRAYSITSDPENGNLLEICFNLVHDGIGSHYLFERQVGNILRFTGPWGTFVLEHPPQTECVFIADGVGIAPMRPMIKRALALNIGRSVRLLYSALNEECLLYCSELQLLEQRYAQFSFTPLLSIPSGQWDGLAGASLETVEQQYVRADGNRDRHFYICGVGNQVTALRDLLRQSGYQRRAVQYEKW